MQAAHPWAVGGSIVAHALIGAWLWLAPAPEHAGAVAAGTGGLAVAMGPAGSAAGATAPTELPTADAVDVSEEVAAIEEAPAPVEEMPVVEAEEVPVEPAASETAPTEVPEAEPPPPDVVPTQEVAAVEPPDQEPVQVEEVATAEPVEARPVVQTPPPPARRPPRPPRPEPVAEQAVAEAAPALPGTGSGPSGTTAAPDAGSGDASQGGGQVGDLQNYFALLSAWLERHKEYPRLARSRRQEGTVLLRFTIDRSGRLLGWKIVEGSGHAILDREVGTMLERAQPMPAMPEEVRMARLDVTVPIRFGLR